MIDFAKTSDPNSNEIYRRAVAMALKIAKRRKLQEDADSLSREITNDMGLIADLAIEFKAKLKPGDLNEDDDDKSLEKKIKEIAASAAVAEAHATVPAPTSQRNDPPTPITQEAKPEAPKPQATPEIAQPSVVAPAVAAPAPIAKTIAAPTSTAPVDPKKIQGDLGTKFCFQDGGELPFLDEASVPEMELCHNKAGAVVELTEMWAIAQVKLPHRAGMKGIIRKGQVYRFAAHADAAIRIAAAREAQAALDAAHVEVKTPTAAPQADLPKNEPPKAPAQPETASPAPAAAPTTMNASELGRCPEIRKADNKQCQKSIGHAGKHWFGGAVGKEDPAQAAATTTTATPPPAATDTPVAQPHVPPPAQAQAPMKIAESTMVMSAQSSAPAVADNGLDANPILFLAKNDICLADAEAVLRQTGRLGYTVGLVQHKPCHKFIFEQLGMLKEMVTKYRQEEEAKKAAAQK